jgi:MFS family permease
MKSKIAIIFTIVFVDLLGFGIVIPILPMYAEHGFGASDIMTGFLVASFSAFQLLMTPVWGRISDNIGRKPVLIIGLAFSSIGYIIFGLAATLPVLFLSRVLAGIGGANISAAQAYIADVTTVEERVKGMGVIGAAFGLGFAFGPFLGGTLSSIDMSWPGFGAAILSGISLLLTLFFLPESSRNVDESRKQYFSFKEVVSAFRRPRINKLLMLFFLTTFAYANINATFPILSHREFGLSDREIGYLFGFIGIVGAFTQGGLIRVLSRRIDESRLFTIGCFMAALGLVMIPYYYSMVTLLLVLTVLSLGTGVMNPSIFSLFSRHASSNEQGIVLGIGQSMGALGRVLGPIWGGIVFQSAGTIYPFITGGGVMLFAAIMAMVTLRPGKART